MRQELPVSPTFGLEYMILRTYQIKIKLLANSVCKTTNLRFLNKDSAGYFIVKRS